MAIIEKIVQDWLWGTPLIVIVLAIGIFMTVRSGFFPIAHFGHVMKKVFGSITRGGNESSESKGVLSSLQATSVAIGTTVGVGNIGGVAAAIALGGPGAVFWMWIAGFLGMILKFSEITLAVHFRSDEKDGSGETYGGPNYYMHKGIGEKLGWKSVASILSFVFAFGFCFTYIVTIQTYTVAEAVASTFHWDILTVAIVFTILLYLMISGGLPQIGKIAAVLVPFMCIFYILAGIFIICSNASLVPESLKMIFTGAFSGTAAVGGFGGAAFAQAIKTGMARSVFSNEAGWGSAAMVHSTAKVDHPVKQGMFGIFEVFVDTFLICTITALVIITSGAWSSGLDGATLTLTAFETGVGTIGRTILAIATLLFGITTSTGGFIQVGVVLRYLLGDRPLRKKLLSFYKWTFPLPPLIMVMIAVFYGMPGAYLWLIADASTALPIFANLLALVILSPTVFKLLADYKARYMNIGRIDPEMELFYDRAKEREQKKAELN